MKINVITILRIFSVLFFKINKFSLHYFLRKEKVYLYIFCSMKIQQNQNDLFTVVFQ